MNRQIIESNIKEAREQLEKVEKRLSANLTEGELLMMLQHAYHHLNFADKLKGRVYILHGMGNVYTAPIYCPTNKNLRRC